MNPLQAPSIAPCLPFVIYPIVALEAVLNATLPTIFTIPKATAPPVATVNAIEPIRAPTPITTLAQLGIVKLPLLLLLLTGFIFQ